jgi:shikimate dehydrogenase
MRRFGLIGFPLSHSFSKKYFEEKFEREGMTDHCYELFPMESVDDLPQLISSLPDLVGLNVTIPHKQSVIRLLQYTDHLPAALPACNCIKIENGEMHGYNTDWVGFEKSLKPLLGQEQYQALVLGNGGAAMAVKYVLQRLDIPYQTVGRKPGTGIHLLYPDLNEQVMAAHQLIINTTPLGTYPDIHSAPNIPYELITEEHFLYDLVYNPSVTRFLQNGLDRSARVKNGYDMLLSQAEAAWEIWKA